MPREHIEFKLFESDPVSAFNFAQTGDNVDLVQIKSETDANAETNTETERDPLLTWEAKPAKTHPMDYFVPNFGIDGSIQSTFDSLAVAEKITGHHWQFVDPKDRPKPPPTDYAVPNFGVDADIKMTQEEIGAAEKKLNHKWNFVPKKDRPKPHPVDYFVPSFGEDPEIKDTQESEVEAATQVWSDRLKAQIGGPQATAQIQQDAAEYRAAAAKARAEADAAAAAARAAEADAKAATERAVAADAADAIKQRLIDQITADQARADSWAKTDAAKEKHWAQTQVERERDISQIHKVQWEKTRAALAADRAGNEALVKAGQEKRAAEAKEKAEKAAAAASAAQTKANVEAEL